MALKPHISATIVAALILTTFALNPELPTHPAILVKVNGHGKFSKGRVSLICLLAHIGTWGLIRLML